MIFPQENVFFRFLQILIGQENPIADVTGCIVADDGLQEGGEGQGGDAGGQGGQAGGDPLHI